MSAHPGPRRTGTSASVRLMLGIDPNIDSEFLANLIDTVADPIFVKDRSLRYVLLNRALCELVGQSRADLLGRTDYDIFPREQADFSRDKELEAFRSGAPVSVDKEIVTDVRGVVRVMSTTKIPLRDPDGEMMHLVGIMHDITALERAQTDLRVANEGLEARVTAATAELCAAHAELLKQERLATLGTLAGGLAHQIRNPLSVIANATNILKRVIGANVPDSATDALTIIREEVWHANGIISDLVEYARVREAVRVPFDVRDLVEQAIAGQEIISRVQVVHELPELPPVLVDPRQVRGAIENLVRNAVEAMPRGGTLTIQAKVEGDAVALSIEDTGDGIPYFVRSRLFEPLLTTKPEGLGLGLTTAKALVENQGGQIRHEPRPEGGTRFVLLLPLV